MRNQSGFTLIELMITVGMIAVLSAIALPVYNGYVADLARGRAGQQHCHDRSLSRRTTGCATASISRACSTARPTQTCTVLGWQPQENDGTVYTIVLAGSSYNVTATDRSGTTVCRQFPEKIACP